MARTPLRAPRPVLALVAVMVLMSAACSATPSLISVDAASSADTAVVDKQVRADELHRRDGGDPPAALAFVEDDGGDRDDASDDRAPAEDDGSPASAGLCEASANIWTHSAALNLLGTNATPEMTEIALANVAEWLERSTFFDDDGTADRQAFFDAFTQLQNDVAADFDTNWQTFQASTAYANSADAQLVEAERTALLSFITAECADLVVADLRNQAKERADELIAQFGMAPSEVVESDSLPGHSIFTHSSGRLIASFPTAWSYRELQSDALIDLVASPKIQDFLAGDAMDGVRIQLVEATDRAAFEAQMATTDVAASCFETNTLSDQSPVRINITQTFECSDHGATVIGQYSADRSLGVLIQARFDRVDPSRGDLIRLASISNSVLWS